MSRLSITISDELNDELVSKVEGSERFSSKADVVRHFIERGRHVADLERELEHKEARIEELRNQITARDQQQDQIEALERRMEDQQNAADAPFFVRWARWWRRRE